MSHTRPTCRHGPHQEAHSSITAGEPSVGGTAGRGPPLRMSSPVICGHFVPTTMVTRGYRRREWER